MSSRLWVRWGAWFLGSLENHQSLGGGRLDPIRAAVSKEDSQGILPPRSFLGAVRRRVDGGSCGANQIFTAACA